MVKLSEKGAYLINGTELVEESEAASQELAAKCGRAVSKEEAVKNTIAYGILTSHNTYKYAGGHRGLSDRRAG